MKVEFNDGFKIVLVAETQLERLFMVEWELRSAIPIEDHMRMEGKHINPQYIDWKYKEQS